MTISTIAGRSAIVSVSTTFLKTCASTGMAETFGTWRSRFSSETVTLAWFAANRGDVVS